MSNEKRNRKIFGILCLLVALIAVSFAYASLTHTLKVKASLGNQNGLDWEVRFENLSSANKVGSTIENSAPTIILPLKIGNFKATFFTPGDSISYTFDVANRGRIDAMLSNVTLTRPTCVGNSTDCTNVLKNLNYSLYYADGNELKYGDALYAGSVGNVRKMKLTVTYSSNVAADELPKADVIIDNLEAILVYIQKD